MQRGRIYFCQSLFLPFQDICQSGLSPSLGHVAGLRLQTLGRQLSSHVPQPSCCQNFPATRTIHWEDLVEEMASDSFTSTWPGSFICETVWLLLKLVDKTASMRWQNPQEKHIHTKANAQPAGRRIRFPTQPSVQVSKSTSTFQQVFQK